MSIEKLGILTQRQKRIFEYIEKSSDGAKSGEIRSFLEKRGEKVTRITVVRDLDVLLRLGLIEKEGAGRSVKYAVLARHPWLGYIDPETYFSKDTDSRELLFPSFNFSVFDKAKDLIDESEQVELEGLNDGYRRKIEAASPTIVKKEFERLTIELAWKSSQIEGNTYSLIDTEVLIKEKKEAAGHQKSEAVMILNHKAAFDFILSDPRRFQCLSLHEIENIHSLLVQDLGVGMGFRKSMVGITGTRYRPIDNEYQIREAMEKLVMTVNAEKFPVAKALLVSLLIAYIQPFEDGNKRTSRLLANALLLAFGYCPLSFRSIDEAEYKKAVVLFYEQNNARYLKELFLKQFRFSVENVFGG